jgi:hypothetical protein
MTDIKQFDGTPVVDENDGRPTTVFKVIGEPFLNANNVWGVQDEPVWQQ